MRMNPESPKFKAVISLLFKTQIVAVALPGKCVLRKPITNWINISEKYDIKAYWTSRYL
jgi:hypothetical protein